MCLWSRTTVETAQARVEADRVRNDETNSPTGLAPSKALRAKESHLNDANQTISWLALTASRQFAVADFAPFHWRIVTLAQPGSIFGASRFGRPIDCSSFERPHWPRITQLTIVQKVQTEGARSAHCVAVGPM
jgi:hypothetical protein